MTWYVYVARCNDDSLYCGVARDVLARIAQHDAGKGARYTRGRGPLTVLLVRRCKTHGNALRAEYAFKQLTRVQKERAIAEPSTAGVYWRRWCVVTTTEVPPGIRTVIPPSRCEDPAGASPVSVGAGAPSSRPAAEGETPTAEAGYRKRASQRELISEKQVRGSQLHVKPAASTENNPRAEPTATKASTFSAVIFASE